MRLTCFVTDGGGFRKILKDDYPEWESGDRLDCNCAGDVSAREWICQRKLPFACVAGWSLSKQSHFMNTRRTESPFDAPSVAQKGFVGHPCPAIPVDGARLLRKASSGYKGKMQFPPPNSLPGCCIDNLICSHAHYFEFCLAEIDQFLSLFYKQKEYTCKIYLV